jgi:hypothetical protein
MVNKSDFIGILVLHWMVFALAFLGFAAYMNVRNMNNKLQYVQYFQESINSHDLQDIMCNGSPVG